MKVHNILVYTENYLPSMGGLENNTVLLCESLVSLGHNVTLITPQKNALRNLKFEVLAYQSFSSFYNKLKANDLLIINGGVAFKAILPALLTLKPFFIIYQMATLYKDIRNNKIKTIILNGLRKQLASLAAKNIAVSEYSYFELKNVFGNKKSALLINPADPLFINTTKSSFYKPLKCLIAGRLIEGKGVKLLVNAVLEINNELPNSVDLHIIGDGEEREFVEEASSNAHIHYHATMSKNKLKDFLCGINLTIVPSTSHIEGSPLIMAESFAMGIPVLVSSQPALMESVRNEYLIFESGNLNSLKEKILYLTKEHNYSVLKNHSLALAHVYAFPNYIKNLKLLLNV